MMEIIMTASQCAEMREQALIILNSGFTELAAHMWAPFIAQCGELMK